MLGQSIVTEINPRVASDPTTEELSFEFLGYIGWRMTTHEGLRLYGLSQLYDKRRLSCQVPNLQFEARRQLYRTWARHCDPQYHAALLYSTPQSTKTV